MDPEFISILFYVLMGIGFLLLAILVVKVVFKGEEISKNSATWLIVAFICIVFPVVGSLTIEYGDFKISLTKLTSDAKEVSSVIESLTEDNKKLKKQLEDLNIQITNSKSTLLNEDVSQLRKTQVLNSFQDDIEMISNQSVSVEKNLNSVFYKNNELVKDLDQRSRRIK